MNIIITFANYFSNQKLNTNKMRKLFGLLVIAAMVGFAACGNGNKGDAKPVDSSAAQVVKADTTVKADTAKKVEAAPEAAKK